MSSDPLNDEGRAAQETPSRPSVEPAYFRWLGHPIVLNYSKGSKQLTEETTWELVKGPVEGREAIFVLEEAGHVGVLVRRIMRDEDESQDIGPAVFIPWSSIHSMFSLSEDEEGDEAAD